MDMFIASLLPHLPALPDTKQIMWELIRAGDLVMIDLQRLLLLDRSCN